MSRPVVDWGWWRAAALVTVVLASFIGKGLTLDVREQLVFYGAYHTNFYNQLIHLFCVPLIWWSFVVWLEGTNPLTCALPAWCNFAWVTWLIYSLLYVWLAGPLLGGLVDAFYGALYLSARRFVRQHTHKAGPSAKPSTDAFAWKMSALTNAFGWYLQLHPGHAIFERRKPGLMDALGQSLLVAPLFVFYELSWWLGFMPELRGEVALGVEAMHRAWAANATSLAS